MPRNCFAIVLLLAIAGCGSNASQPRQTATAAPSGEVFGTPAPGSKFSRIQIGMPMKQVTDLIGQPTDTSMHVTGKVFIPFYFGGDTTRTETFYRGEGQLTFSAAQFGSTNYVLEEIHVNPAETGYAH